MKEDVLQIAQRVFTEEASAINRLKDILTIDFELAVKTILACEGRVIVTGLGKSGIIGRKIAATLASTGTSSVFIHPTEAFHGDLGMTKPIDVVIAITNSGETDEILRLIPCFKNNGNKIIAITGNPLSTLAINADYNLNINVSKEVCPLNLAPTSSTTSTLVMGDALAIALMEKRNFKSEDFAQNHPGGSLGRRLLTRVKDIMRTKNLPVIAPNSCLKEVINTMSSSKLGLALVNIKDATVGVITDGDLRRLMEDRGKDAFDFVASEIMSKKPKTIRPQETLIQAELVFNDFKINSLVVVNPQGATIGVVQIYDLT